MTVAGGAEVTLRLMLASDADRDIALALLREASVDGRLTLEDLAERAELVHAARTREEVAAATAGLEVAAAAPAEAAVRHRALLSSFTRQGRWRIAAQCRYSAVFGSIKLDLRDAVLPGPEVDIEVKAVFGSVEVIVPEGVLVRAVRRRRALEPGAEGRGRRAGRSAPDPDPPPWALRVTRRAQQAAAGRPDQGQLAPVGRAAERAARMTCWGP